MSELLSVVWICALTCWNIDAARILAVIPTPSISHQVPFRPLTQELASRGHEVMVITTDPAFPKGQAPANLTEIDVRDISYEIWRKAMATHTSGNTDSFEKLLDVLTEACLIMFEKQAKVAEIRNIIDNKNNAFDLLMLEAWPRFLLGYLEVVKAPVIAMSSFGAVLDNYDTIAGPSYPMFYPEAPATRIYELSLWEKITKFYNNKIILNNFKNVRVIENTFMKRIFGETTPDLSELQNNVGMMFLNIHPVWEGNCPVPISVVHMAGIDRKPDKVLPQDLKQFLDSSVHGVIYLSFGTNVETSALPADTIQTIINVFSQLPYDVLWKWNQDELPGRTNKIRISKWFPQSDVLKHPKIKLFITQGGLQSSEETITAGVPVIGIPMFGDQFYNVQKYEHLNIGKKIYLDELNKDILRSAIKVVIEDKCYRENVVRLRTLMYDQPMSSLERAVWWTEHVLRHGARHLRAPAANMGAFEYYELQLVLTALAIVSVVTLLGCIGLYTIIRLLLKLKVSTKIKTS